MPKITQEFIDKLSRDISIDSGNPEEDELNKIDLDFNKTLTNALNTFNSSVYDKDGFMKKIMKFDTGNPEDKDTIKNILSGVKHEYSAAKSLNHSEILLRYDLYNIRTQMPEMNDVINTIRDGIIECNTSTGEISRTIKFENNENKDQYENQVFEIERRHDLQYGIKNFIIPDALSNGEMYILCKPYAKIFAELEVLGDTKNNSFFKESLPNYVKNKYSGPKNLYNENNIKYLTESISNSTNISSINENKIENNSEDKNINKNNISYILNNIEIFNESSPLIAEMGVDGARKFIIKNYKNYKSYSKRKNDYTHFNEAINNFNSMNTPDSEELQDSIEFKSYEDIKGIYIKYLDSLKVIPIRIDRKIIGYYYITTTIDTSLKHPGQPAGMVDNSYQIYTKDKKMVDRLADIIIQNFDKKILQKNIQLKNEIVEVVMAHKFHEGKLSFVYIPETDVERIVINEDQNGKGHSVLEPSLFNARNYLLLNMYNMLYVLNNTTTRIHYIKSSGLNKDYAATVQRAMRKFQSRRISVDDIYSYTGVLNKVGGIGEMVLPTGRNDYKALETDTIPAVDTPINLEYMEQQRREAISGTPVPHLMILNAIYEVDFAKSLEIANTRFLSTISSFKIDFNKALTRFYQRILKWETDIDDGIIQTFRYNFNTIKQPELVVTADMIQNFNSLFELISQTMYTKEDLEDKDGNPTPKQKLLKKELVKEYIGQIDYDRIQEICDKVDLLSNKEDLDNIAKNIQIEDEDIEEINK